MFFSIFSEDVSKFKAEHVPHFDHLTCSDHSEVWKLLKTVFYKYSPNDDHNIFRFPSDDQTNIKIYLDAIEILFKYINIQLVVSLLRTGKKIITLV